MNVRNIHSWAVVPVGALCTALTFTAATSGTSFAHDPTDRIEASQVQQGYASSPIPKDQLNIKGKNPYLVGVGSYLASAGDCSGCHSFPRTLRPGGTPTNMSRQGSDPRYGDPFVDDAQSPTGQLKANFNVKHFMAGGRCFGSIQARNLTPDDSGRPRGLTEAEFIKVMRVGTDVSCGEKPNPPVYFGQPDGVCDLPRPPNPGGTTYNPALLQTMPWVVYHNMTDADLKAIYAYLSALPKATACNTPADGCSSPNPTLRSGKAATLGLSSGYAYTSTDECPNPPPPQ